MTFLNSLLALGTLAFTIPLVIHLLNRSRYRTVDWGAMIFLEQQQPSNSRKIEWKHLLLLLIRCLIPIFLALAMARPFLSGSSWFGTTEPVAAVIILDDSMSMQSKSQGGQTRWSLALQHAKTICDSLPEGSDYYLILGGLTPEPIDSRVLDDKYREWNRQPSITGRLNLVQSTKIGLDWLNQQSLTRRQIIYISDFQSTDWSDDSESLNDLTHLVNNQAIPPILSWLDVSDSSPIENENERLEFQNYSVGETILAPKWFAEGQAVTALCTIHNHSRTPVNSLAVSWRLDNELIESQKINIAPSSSTRVTARFLAPKKGWHLVEVKLDVVDDLEFDNRKQVPFLVQNKSPIVLIDGGLRPEPMQSESDFLRIALSPFTFSPSSGTDYFDTKVMTIDKLHNTSVTDANVIVLCNVPRIDHSISVNLRKFADDGGGVVVFLGDKVDADAWNQLPSLDQSGIRFFTITKGAESPVVESAEDEEKLTIDIPETVFFRDLSQTSLASLASISVDRFTAISILPESAPDRIASFNNGIPWIIRRDTGKGSIWVVTTSCNSSDSNLPTRPVFVPLMQRLIHAASNSKPAIEVIDASTPWIIRFDDNDGNPSDVKSSSIQIQVPRNQTETSTDLAWTNTRQIGLYRATLGDDGKRREAYCWVDPNTFSKAKSVESGREDLAEEELIKIAESAGAKCFFSIDSFVALSDQIGKGREIGNWFWLAALICFLVEMAIAQSFSIRRSQSRSPAISQLDSPTRRGSI